MRAVSSDPSRRSSERSGRASLSVALRGAPLAVADADGRVEVFDSRSQQRIGRIPLARRPPGRGRAVAGRGHAGGRDDRGRPRFLDRARRAAAGRAATGRRRSRTALTFSPDGRWLSTGGGDNVLRLWDARRRIQIGTLERSVADVSFSPDGETLAVTLREENFDGGLEILAVPSLEVVRTVPAPPGTVGRFSRDGDRVRVRRSSGSRVDLRHADVAGRRAAAPRPRRRRGGGHQPGRAAAGHDIARRDGAAVGPRGAARRRRPPAQRLR